MTTDARPDGLTAKARRFGKIADEVARESEMRGSDPFAPTYRCTLSIALTDEDGEAHALSAGGALARHALGMMTHLEDGASVTETLGVWNGAWETGLVIESQTYRRRTFLATVSYVARSIGATMVHVQAFADGGPMRSTHWNAVEDPLGDTVRV